MKAGAESGMAAARWLRARGGDYGQESSLLAVTLLLAGSLGLSWGFWGLHIPPSAEQTHGSLVLGGKCSLATLWRRRQSGAAACCRGAVSGEEG